MNKVNNESLDINNNSIEQLKQLFPEIVSEGNKIDFNKLKCVLSDQLDDKQERYQFTWNGKRDAIKISNTPTTATLKPIKDKSKNWSETKNVYIEGDNLEVLKILQRSYANKVKVIYIDPPYNTGKDFVFKDSFQSGIENYLEQTGQVDGDGNKLSTNSETNGRFHSDWLSMMYPRLKLGRNLLTDDGIIFISIDDNEQANLKKLCDEIFGEENFIANIIWERAYAPVNLKKHFSESHDYILVYAKNKNKAICHGLPRSEEADERYTNPDNDSRGVWQSDNLSVGPAVEKNIYKIVTPSGREVMPPSGYSWRLSKEQFLNYKEDDRIWFGEDGGNTPRIKRFLSEVKQSITPMTIWKYEDVGHSQSASKGLKELFSGKAYFTYPKPVTLIKQLILLYSEPDSMILDFFSGSATTAEAVMTLNQEDNGNRKYIMVQLDEKISKDNEAYKDGYQTIPEVAIERINRSGEKLTIDDTDKLDIGYRYFKLDKSNIIKWDSQIESADDATALFADNFKVDSTKDDIVFELLLKQGMSLTDNITEKSFDETTVYIINQGEMFMVLGNQITEQIAEYIREYQFSLEKSEVVIAYQDSGFDNDSSKLNSFEILKTSGFDEENIYTV